MDYNEACVQLLYQKYVKISRACNYIDVVHSKITEIQYIRLSITNIIPRKYTKGEAYRRTDFYNVPSFDP